MATILGRVTVNGIDLLEVDQDPTAAGGTSAPVGSIASDSSTGTLYSKTGALDTDWTAVGTGAAGIQTTFVYRPGGVPAANVYTDWALLMADLVAVEGPKIVELDDRFGAITIPAGGPYDMRDTVIRGRLLSGTPVVATIDPGASFSNLERLEWVRLDYTSATPAVVVPAGLQYIRLWGASIQNNGAAPFFDVTTPGAILLSQFGNASGFNPFGGASPVVDLGGTGFFSFALDEASTNGVDTVAGTAGSNLTVTLRDASAIFEDVTAPTFTGTFAGVTLRPQALNTSYDPLLFPSGLTSTTVQGSIDELATGASSNIVEYVPGNPGPLRGNQYTTWADVHAAAVRLQPSTIMVDDTDGAAEIPAGAWDMEGITLSAEITSDLLPIPVLTALDGATLTNLGSVSGPLTLTSVSLSPVITAPVGLSWLRVFQGNIQSSAASPFIEVPAGATLFVDMKENGSFIELGGGPVVSLTDATSQLRTFQGEISAVATGTVDAVPGSTVIFNLQSASARAETTSVVGGATPTFGIVPNSRRVTYDDAMVAPPIVGGGISDVQTAIDALKVGGAFGITDTDGDTSVTVEQPAGTDTDTTIFTNNGSESMRVSPTGSLLIGRTAPVGSELLSVQGDAAISGNLLVEGTTTSTRSEVVRIADNHLYLNDGYTTTSAQTGGLVVNYFPTGSSVTVDVGGFTAGVPAVSNPTVAVSGVLGLPAGVLLQVSGAANDANNGLYELLSEAAGVLTMRGIGLTGTVEDFTQNQFVTDSTVAGEVRMVNVSVIRAGTNGDWEVGEGLSTPISFTDLLTTAALPTNLWQYGGNTVGSEQRIGTNDAFDFVIETSGVERVRIDSATPDITIAAGPVNTYRSISIGNAAFAIGLNAQANGFALGFAIGFNANASGGSALALGPNTVANQTGAVAIGDNADATSSNATALGVRSNASGSAATAFGSDAQATGFFAVSIGTLSTASGNSSVAIGGGNNTDATADSAIAIGRDAVADQASSVALGRDSNTTAPNQFMVGATTRELNAFINGTLTLNSSVAESSPVATYTTLGASGDSVQVFVGQSDPSAGGGVAAPVGSLFHRDSGGAGTTGEIYLKFGAANTDWSLLATGSGNSLQQAYEVGNAIVTDTTNGDVDISGTEDFVVDMDGAIAITGDTAVTVTGGAVADASAVSVFLQGATSTGAGNAGGDVTVNAGNPGVGADGGGVTLTATAGNDTGLGGFVNISAGDSGAGATGDGGDIVASAGDAASTNGDGGSIILNPGAGSGTGTDGEVVVNGKLTVTGLIDPTGLVLTGQFASPDNPATVLTGTVSVTNTNLTGTVSVDVSQITGTVSTGETPLTGTVTVGVTPLTGTVTLGVTVLTGTVTVAAGTPNVTGAGTLFTSELLPGDFIDIAGEIRQVGVINNDTSLTLLTNHVAGAAGVAYSLRFQDSTLNGTGTLFTVELSPGDTVEFGGQFRQVASITNDTTLDLTATADSVEGVAATLRFSSTAVSGVGTLFTTELSPGDMIRFNEEVVEVQSIADNTNLTLVSPHTNTALNETAILEALTTTVFGVGTLFTAELDVGDFLSVSGSTLEIASITNDTELDLVSIHPSISNGQPATKFDSEVVGSGTLFTTETSVGSFIGISGGFYLVETVASNTSLTIASPTPGPISGASAVSYDPTVTGVGTLFTTELSPGDFVSINGETAQIDTIGSDTSLTLTGPLLVGASGDPIFAFGTDGTFWVDQGVSPTLPMFTDSAGVDHVLAYEDGSGPLSLDSRIEDGDGDTSVDVDPGGLDTDTTIFTNSSQESMRITPGGFLGVGTSSPATKIHAAGATDDAGAITAEIASDAPEDFPTMDLCRAEGSLSSQTSVSNGTTLGAVAYKGYDGTQYGTGAEVIATSSEDWDGASHGTDLSVLLSENGTTSLENRLTLTNAGNLGLSRVIPGARLAATNSFGTALTGTVTVAGFSTAVTGTGTLFTTELRVGAPLRIDNEEFTVAAIASDTALTLSSPTAGGHLNSVALTDQDLFLFEDSQGTARFGMDGIGVATLDGDLEITGKLTVGGLIDPTGLVLVEQASDPASTGAGEGTFWVRDDSPNVPMFTDDAGVDHNLLEGGTSEAVTFPVNQTGHGFSVLDALSHDGANFIAAQSDNASTLGYWLVYEVIDVDNFRVAYAGQVSVAAHGLTPGQFYFVSPTVAGDLTTTEPTTTGQFSNPLVYVRDANTLEVLAFRPSEVLSAPVAATLQSAYDNGPTIAMTGTVGDFEISGSEAILLNASIDSNFIVDGGDLTLQTNSGGSVFVLADEDAELRGGNTVTVRGSDGVGSGDGAPVTVVSGDSGGAGGNGGNLTIQSGGGFTNAGNIELFGGDAGSGDGGFINLVAGDGGSQGGGLNFVGGTASAGDGGGVAFVGGGGNGGVSTGGGISFQGGVANTGGFVSFAGGASAPGGTGPGGSLMFNGGNAGAATNGDGGGLTFTGGAGNGTGDGGNVVLSGGLGGATGTDGSVGVGAADPNVEFNVAGTGAVRVPSGTTAERPATPPTGALRVNSQTGNGEFYNGTSWVQWGGMPPVVFKPQDSQPPASVPAATLSTRGVARPQPLIAFDPTTNEETMFMDYMPTTYGGGDLVATVVWASTASGGDVEWALAFERQDAGVYDLDGVNFAALRTNVDTAPGAQGVIVYTTITFTNAQADGIQPGECFRIRLVRNATSGSDTNAGDAQVVRVIIEEDL